MGRLVGVLTAISLLVPALPVAAAEMTRVATAGDPDNPFDLDLSIRWDRVSRSAKIVREGSGTSPQAGADDTPALTFSQVTNTFTARVGISLYQDLELHVEVPYVFGDEVSWKPTSAVDPAGYQTGVTPSGNPVSGLPVDVFNRSTTVYHGGVAGDVKAGLSWGVFSDRRDDTKPFWLVGLDITFPSAKLYDPSAQRTSSWDSSYNLPARTAPIGQKVWHYEAYTALSKRMGSVDPYFRFGVTGMQKSASTYSNCTGAANAAAVGADAFSDVAVANCATEQWKTTAGAHLPFLVGVTFGAELIPFQDRAAGEKIAIDLRISSQYTSSARWYNELTDATGKLLATEAFLTTTGMASVLFRASEYIAIQGGATMSYTTSHYLTGEKLGSVDPTTPPASRADQNPNFDWRYDAPGRRFRLTEATSFGLQVTGMLNF